MVITKMTPSTLKYHVEQTGSYFFTRSSMKFFGDSMRNYGVRSKPVTVTNSLGESIECWELYRKEAVKHGLWESAYFNTKTFERVHPKR